MKVVNVSTKDHANYSWHNAQALKSVGVDCESYCMMMHGFKYEVQSEVLTHEQMRVKIFEADIVQVMHSDIEMISLIPSSKRIIVWHTGSNYRQKHDYFNKAWRGKADLVVCALAEFMKLAPKGAIYQTQTYDAKDIEAPSYKLDDALTVAHYPSKREVKGSDAIDKVMLDYKDKVVYQTGAIIESKENLKRYKGVDVYIELMATHQNGKEYGSHGITALEAASNGCIVITNDMNKHIYKEAYGETGLIICNTVEELRMVLDGLLQMNRQTIDKLKNHTYQWYLKNHSHKAQGQRLKNMLENL